MNNIEFGFTFVTWLVFVLALWRIPVTTKQRIGIAACALIAIGWSFLDATQIVTIDEGVCLGETSGTILPTWILGELRTTDLVFGVAQKLAAPAHVVLSAAALKALHTCFCLVLYAALVVLVTRLCAAELEPAPVALALIGLLLLPTTLIAAKVLNYDFFVMTLSAITVFLILLAFKTRNFRYLWLAVPLSALAAQEKMIATPLMFATVLLTAFAVGSFGRWPTPLAAAARVAIALLVCIAVVLLSALALALLRPADEAAILGNTLLRPLTQFAGTIAYFAFHLAPDQYSAPPLAFLAGLIAVLVLLAAASPYIWRAAQPTVRRLLQLPWNPIAALAALLFFAIAVYADAHLTMYWAPFHAVPSGGYQPGGGFNGATTHFASASVVLHLVASCAAAIAMFWAATPTAIWIALLVGLGLSLYRRSHGFDPTPQIMVCAALALPLAWGVFQLPTGIGGKYFNIGILMLSIAAVWIFLRGMSAFGTHVRAGAAATVLGLFVLEVALFLPLCFDFRPFYAPPSEPPRIGEPTYRWPGWGEEVGLAAKGVRARIPSAEHVGLRYFYPGAFFDDPQVTATMGAQGAQYTSSEYFVVSRLAVVEGLGRLPLDVAPEFTIGGFGQPYAWVFRGDRLREAGFAF